MSQEPNDTNALAAFVELVRQMRFNQRRYERNPKAHISSHKKELEERVDEFIALQSVNQTKLFK